MPDSENPISAPPTHAILQIRGRNVITDAELAAVFGVETRVLNQAVKRNADRFGERYAFQLTEAEFAALRSQTVTSNPGRGGRRYAPWVFTEHGVVMAATVLDSERAAEASKLIVDVFVEVKRRLVSGAGQSLALIPSPGEIVPLPAAGPLGKLTGLWEGMGPRLQAALNHVLDTVINTKDQATVREEAQNLISESIEHLKERLKKSGLENEELAARATKLLAEAEKEKSIAARTKVETAALEFNLIVRKLRLLIEAHRAMAENKVDDFLLVLKELGGPSQ
jgi:hypothetical protein